MDPWTPIDPIHEPNLGDLDSERYLASLEAKLKRMKGHNKESTAKDLLHGLADAKNTGMAMMTQSTDSPYLSNYTSSDDRPIDISSFGAALQRKLQPEKQALTSEELSQLLEYDELAKVNLDLQAEEDNNTNTLIDAGDGPSNAVQTNSGNREERTQDKNEENST